MSAVLGKNDWLWSQKDLGQEAVQLDTILPLWPLAAGSADA